MTDAIDYSAPGRLTDLGEVSGAVLETVPADPVGICRLVPGLVLHPFEAADLDLDAGRLAGQQIRPASAIIGAVLALDPAALDIPREPERRLVGTCRTFVVLSCALLRHRGIAARARCGFGTYFQPGLGLDHWITEYWQEAGQRWVRVDTQHLEHSFSPGCRSCGRASSSPGERPGPVTGAGASTRRRSACRGRRTSVRPRSAATRSGTW